MAEIIEAVPTDIEHIRRISSVVFTEYGDYSNILPKFFSSQGVSTYLAKIGTEVVGFLMLGFIPWSAGDKDGHPWIGDLLAIAVEPSRQRQGVGKQLMEKAFDLTQQMCEWRDIKEIQLTCAESNKAGLQFFQQQGFYISNPNHGTYSGGQRAVRLSHKIEY
jgi:ribosomal protein S18 acetylase RimI-like enzyme